MSRSNAELEYMTTIEELEIELAATKQENAVLKAQLGRVKEVTESGAHYGHQELSKTMKATLFHQFAGKLRDIDSILYTAEVPLAVVDGYKLEELDWPFIAQEVAGDALLGVWETKPAEGWSHTPVTVIVMPKEKP